jgi:hypothetical protein
MRTEQAPKPRVRLVDLAPSAKQLEEQAEALRRQHAGKSDPPAPAGKADDRPA